MGESGCGSRVWIQGVDQGVNQGVNLGEYQGVDPR